MQGAEPGSPAARRTAIKASRLESIVADLANKVKVDPYAYPFPYPRPLLPLTLASVPGQVDIASNELRAAEADGKEAESRHSNLINISSHSQQ